MERDIEGVNSYTWEEIQRLIHDTTEEARSQMVSSEKGVIERFNLTWITNDRKVLYSFGEQLETGLGTRISKRRYLIPEKNLIRTCIDAILRKRGVSESRFSEYSWKDLEFADAIPERSDDFFCSFEIVSP